MEEKGRKIARAAREDGSQNEKAPTAAESETRNPGTLGKGMNLLPEPSYSAQRESAVLVRTATAAEVAKWDEIVVRFENCRVFHKKGWIRSLEAFSGAKAVYLVFDKENEIVGCLPGFLVSVGFLKLFCSPREGWQTESMGPVFNKERLSTPELFGALIPFLEKQFGVHHIELASTCLDRDAMLSLGFRYEPLHSYRVPLHPGDEERTMKNINGKTRNQLRKAVKLGLCAKIESDESFVDEFYDQLKEVFTRRGSAVPFGPSRALQLFKCMKESGNLLAISIALPGDGTCIATGIFTIEGPELSLWMWTHRTQYRWYCPTELLTWTAMKKGMEAGCVTLDMSGGGGGKAKFGAVLDETNYRWIRSRYKWLTLLRRSAKKTYKWQQAFRGGMLRRLTSRRRSGQTDRDDSITERNDG